MKTYTLQLRDEKAVNILERFPEEERSQIAAKYIVLGDTVMQYAQVVTSEESLQKYFKPVISDLERICKEYQEVRESFTRVIPSLAKSSTKGAISCEAVFQSLQDTFQDDRFEDVSAKKARFTDILGYPRGIQQPIFIEVKDYSDAVPSDEVDKFWRDMDARKASVGCFFSMRTSIRNVTSDFNIVPNGSRVGVFVVSEAVGGKGHILGYRVGRKLLELIVQQGSVAAAEKYEWIAQVIRGRIKEFGAKMQDLEQIKARIECARQYLDQNLTQIIAQISGLHDSLTTVIQITLNDFSEYAT